MAFEVAVGTAKRGVTGFRREIAENVVETALFRSEVQSASNALDLLAATTGAIGVGLSLKEMTERATEYNNAMVILRSTAGSQAGMVQDRLYDIGQAASTSATDLAALTKSLGGMEGGIHGALNVVEGVALAMSSIPTTAEASTAALRQFTQAMQAGVLRGDEFQSVMEGSPGLVDALVRGLQQAAPELEVTKNNLRSLAEEGELTSDRLSRAFTAVLPSLREMAAETELTLDQQAQRLENAVTQFSGRVFNRAGMSETVGRTFDGLIERFERIENQNAAVIVIERVAAAADLASRAVFVLADNMGLLIGVWATWNIAKSAVGLALFVRGIEAGRAAMALLAGTAQMAGPILTSTFRAAGLEAANAANQTARLQATINSGLVKNVGALGMTAALGINPLNILVTLLGVAATGWVAYASSASDAQKATMLMADTTDMIRDGMAEASKTTASAAEAMAEYARQSDKVATQRAITNIETQMEALEDAADTVTARLYAMGDIRTMGPMAARVAKLRLEFQRGTITIDGMREALAGIVETDPDWRRRAEGVYEASDAYDDAARNVRKAEAALAAIKGTATDAQLALLGVGDAMDSAGGRRPGAGDMDVDGGGFDRDAEDDAYHRRIESAEQAADAVSSIHQTALLQRLDDTERTLMEEQVRYQEHLERLRELELEGAGYTEVYEARQAVKAAHEARMLEIHRERLDRETAEQARANGDIVALIQQNEIRIARMKGQTIREIELKHQQTLERIAQWADEGADAQLVAQARATAGVIKAIELREAREKAATAASVQNAETTASAWEQAAARIAAAGSDVDFKIDSGGGSSGSSGQKMSFWIPGLYQQKKIEEFPGELAKAGVSKQAQRMADMDGLPAIDTRLKIDRYGVHGNPSTRSEIDEHWSEKLRRMVEAQRRIDQAQQDIASMNQRLQEQLVRERGDELAILEMEHRKTIERITRMERDGADAAMVAAAKKTAQKIYLMKKEELEARRIEEEAKRRAEEAGGGNRKKGGALPFGRYGPGTWINGLYYSRPVDMLGPMTKNGDMMVPREVMNNLGSGYRYAEGGIAGHPPGTVPAFLERNTEAAVPLRSGRIPVEIRERAAPSRVGRQPADKAPARPISVALHVHGVNDADSFRRSEGQVAARLSRLVARAARGT
jgi:tape measure domain-containing protein